MREELEEFHGLSEAEIERTRKLAYEKRLARAGFDVKTRTRKTAKPKKGTRSAAHGNRGNEAWRALGW